MRTTFLFFPAGMLVAAPAFACWDSESATVGPVCISYSHGESDEFEWNPGSAKELATWATRIGEILPAGARVNLHYGDYSACSDGGERPGDLPYGTPVLEYCPAKGECLFEPLGDSDLDVAFKKVAAIARVPGFVRRTVKTRERAVYTVQFLATTDEHEAYLMESRIDAATVDLTIPDTFYAVSGHPGRETWTGIVRHQEKDGVMLYRVLAGTWLDPNDAETARAAIQKSIGSGGFVRAIPDEW